MHKAGKEVVGNVLDACVKARYPIYQLTPWKKEIFFAGSCGQLAAHMRCGAGVGSWRWTAGRGG